MRRGCSGANDRRRKAFVLISEGIGKDLSGIFGAMAPPASRRRAAARTPSGDLAGSTAVLQGAVSRHRAGRHDGVAAPRERRDLCDRPTRQGRVKGSRARVFSGAEAGRRSVLEWHDRLGQSGAAGAARARDHVRGVRRICRHQHRRLHVRASAASSATSIITTCSDSIPSDPKGKGYRPLDVRPRAGRISGCGSAMATCRREAEGVV